MSQRRFGGLALLVGGLMHAAFWSGPVRDLDISLVESHSLQLVFYGVMIGSLGFGLWRAARANIGVSEGKVAMVGSAIAILGLVSFIWIEALGLLVLGAALVPGPKNRLIGLGLVAGPALWFVMWARGARFDSEGSAPLSALEKLLATSGLVLIAAGLIGLGLALIRQPSRHDQEVGPGLAAP